ncbi:hypothetical protein C4H12_08290 [Capnocytophaga sp. oral taxon 878]|nr:hypothetical protein C4H12_08290 [Capnocytophaga sp. oral taxon 878]
MSYLKNLSKKEKTTSIHTFSLPTSYLLPKLRILQKFLPPTLFPPTSYLLPDNQPFPPHSLTSSLLSLTYFKRTYNEG